MREFNSHTSKAELFGHCFIKLPFLVLCIEPGKLLSLWLIPWWSVFILLLVLIVVTCFSCVLVSHILYLNNLSCKSYLYMRILSNQHKKSSCIFSSTCTKEEKLWVEYNRDNRKAQRLKTKDAEEMKGSIAKGHDSSFCYFLGCNLWNQFSFWKFANFLPLQSKIQHTWVVKMDSLSKRFNQVVFVMKLQALTWNS